ncbi:uncharacterized protein PSFLO_04280 [Pseudozyma flocculosa]|uniref:Uncharacterized protein n=1 Tax=Pseudozyma flocculosa TaxID=84751 RepID=A0A5C3F6C9_9BASI|nr:uncharacterized protein PSFLO_04280 [Pseudozyma flocculosa]
MQFTVKTALVLVALVASAGSAMAQGPRQISHGKAGCKIPAPGKIPSGNALGQCPKNDCAAALDLPKFCALCKSAGGTPTGC